MRTTFCLESLKERDHSEDLVSDGMIICLLKRALRKWDGRVWVVCM
jgi:hypothetical protein